jgi:hypothetical protein
LILEERKMNIPGFTADASLNKKSGRYRTAAYASIQRNFVVSQQKPAGFAKILIEVDDGAIFWMGVSMRAHRLHRVCQLRHVIKIQLQPTHGAKFVIETIAMGLDQCGTHARLTHLGMSL